MSILHTFAGLLKQTDVPNAANGSAEQVLAAGLYIVYFIAGVIAVVAIIIAAFRMVTNNGEPETMKNARQTIIYAVIGIVVIVSAFTITWFFLGRIQ